VSGFLYWLSTTYAWTGSEAIQYNERWLAAAKAYLQDEVISADTLMYMAELSKPTLPSSTRIFKIGYTTTLPQLSRVRSSLLPRHRPPLFLGLPRLPRPKTDFAVPVGVKGNIFVNAFNEGV